MGQFTGYRTLISATLQFLVTLGLISQSDASGSVDAIFAVVSGVMFLSTVYFKLLANYRESALRHRVQSLLGTVKGKGIAQSGD